MATKQINKLLEGALLLQEEGYNVFPLNEGEKTPLAKALSGGSQNSTIEKPLSEDDIIKKWGKYLNANIGIHTGKPSGIVAVDIDVAKNDDEVTKGKRTKEQATILVKQLVALFGETRIHKSPSGGYHLLYRYTQLCDGVGRKINAFKSLSDIHSHVLLSETTPLDLSDIDILAGNGYIVAPPSVLNDGNVYELLHEVDSFEMPDFPEEMIRLLKKRDKTTKAYFSFKDGTNTAISDSNVKERKLKAKWENNGKANLSKSLQQYMGTGSGDRHSVLLKVCGTVFAVLPYSEWKTANQYIDMVISTFTPKYMTGTPSEIEADKREIQNAFNYARANEYGDRVGKQQRDDDSFQDSVTQGLKEIKEIKNTSVTEDEYKEQVQNVFDSFQTDEKGIPFANDYNCAVVLKEHPKYKNRIRFDNFTEELTFLCKIGTKYENHFLEDSKNNPALSRLMQDIQFDFFPKVPRVSVFSAAVSVGHDHDYDSYREKMETLKGKWDGEERMELWLHKMFKLPDDLYHRGVGAQFIFAMVRRAYEPGADFQKVLFLSGAQGVGKGYSMMILAGDEGYLEFNDEIVGREFNLHAKGKTIIDLSEGESMNRSSVGRIKSLISNSDGIHRSFGSGEVKKHPVRYVMSITNNGSPLVDNTGNRRFMVVDIKLPQEKVGDFVWLKTFKDQIFAEGVHKYYKMKEMEKEIKDAIETSTDDKTTYKLHQKRARIDLHEMEIADFGIKFEEKDTDTSIKTFRSEYGVPLIPREVAEQKQRESRMQSPIENEIMAVLLSYDEYRAGSKEFFINSSEIASQLDIDVVRQSRVGGFLSSEVGKLLKVIDMRLEQTRKTQGSYGQLRGVSFKMPFVDAKNRLEAIKEIRKRADFFKPTPPSSFGGGSKAVTLEQKAAKIRWERDGDQYLVFGEKDIVSEMVTPKSVNVEDLVISDDF